MLLSPNGFLNKSCALGRFILCLKSKNNLQAMAEKLNLQGLQDYLQIVPLQKGLFRFSY